MNSVSEVIRYLRHLLLPELNDPKHQQAQVESGIVVSLTTLPSRIDHLKPTISSLLDQSILPETIVVNIPEYSLREKSAYKVPGFLTRNPRIQVNIVKKDLGPATKLLPTLEMHEKSSKLIVVADDDEVYPHDLLKNYLIYDQKRPGHALSLVGWNVPKGNVHAEREVVYGAIGSIPKHSRKVIKPTLVDCVQGASTFAVRPCFFTKEVFDYAEAPREAYFVDDIWFSGHLARQKVPVCVIPAPFRYARMKVVSQLLFSSTLHKKENRTGINNQILYLFFKSNWPSQAQNPD